MKLEKGALIGTGNTANVYEFGGRAVKVFHEHIQSSYILNEYTISQKVRSSGITVPAVYELLEIEGKTAILFEKINGDSLKDHLVNKPLNIVSTMKLMAKLHIEVNGASGLQLPSQKEKLKNGIHHADMLTYLEKKEILKYLKYLPESNKLCHGDFHPDNILVHHVGPVIIDWNDAASGHPAADAARTYLLLKYGGLSEQSGNMYRALRLLISTLYLHFYVKQSLLSKKIIKKWILPVAAARLAENVEDVEKKQLTKQIQKIITEYRG